MDIVDFMMKVAGLWCRLTRHEPEYVRNSALRAVECSRCYRGLRWSQDQLDWVLKH